MVNLAFRMTLAAAFLAALAASATAADGGKPLPAAATTEAARISPAATAAIERLRAMGGEVRGTMAIIGGRWSGGNDGLTVLRDIPGVKRVVCYGSKINDDAMDQLAVLPELESIEFSGPDISDEGLRRLKKASSLKEISLYSGRMTNAGIRHLADVKTLERVAMGSCKTMDFTDDCFGILARLPRLKALDVIATPNITGKGLEALREAPYLEELDLRRTSVDDNGLKGIQRLTSLQVLNLQQTKVTDAGMPNLAKLKNLRKLDLGRTQVADGGMPYLAKATHLEEFNLSDTRVSDVGIRWLAHLNELKQLRLVGVEITDEGMAVIGDLTRLEGLTLSGCRGVSDRSLLHIRKLTNLRSLVANSTGMTDDGLRTLWNDLPELVITGVTNGFPARKGEPLDRMPKG
jgi:internalin A